MSAAEALTRCRRFARTLQELMCLSVDSDRGRLSLNLNPLIDLKPRLRGRRFRAERPHVQALRILRSRSVDSLGDASMSRTSSALHCAALIGTGASPED